MLDKLIKKLEKENKIRKQKVGIIQIEALLKQAVFDLREAKKIFFFRRVILPFGHAKIC